MLLEDFEFNSISIQDRVIYIENIFDYILELKSKAAWRP